ncbi:MAG: hypothetical protein RLZZ210_1379 [Pseudomonadota bacterium]|jgi:dihydropteroate synthase
MNKKLICGSKELCLNESAIMGILNIGDESFFDGGLYIDTSKAINRALEMVEYGAKIIDIGAESTKPQAKKLDLDTELKRLNNIVPTLIKEFENTQIIISIDTYKHDVMQSMLDIGVDLINDVCGFADMNTQKMLANYSCGMCIMHMQNTPQNMQDKPEYEDVLTDVSNFLLERANQIQNYGIDKNRIILDPGFGFGKTLEHNIKILKHFREFENLGYICLAGLSRKSFLGQITGKDVENRLASSLAGGMIALQNGANILRVHDVAETMDMIKMIQSCQSWN